jgi:hypothetical protein
MELEENKTSKFSSGLNIIMRLDVLWKNCQDFKRKGLYSSWNDELDTIWLELARDLSKKEYDDAKENEKKVTKGYKSIFEEFEDRLKKQLPFNDSLLGFKKPDADIFKRRDEQYKILMEKQLYLARLENELDKGTTYEEEDEDF